MPRVKRNRDKVEGQKLKMQEILDTLNVQSSPPDETPSLGKRVPHLTPADSHNVARTSIPESGAPLALFRRSVQMTDCSCSLDPNIPACGRLVRRAFALHELPSLIEVIFSSQDESDTIRRLLGGDAQAFVDVMDEACSTSTRHRETVLMETDIDTFCRPGTR